jgi:hypothetical protein
VTILARPSKRGNSLTALGVCIAVVATTSHARADAPSANEAAAEALFTAAKALMVDGQDAAACPKLAESQRLDPGTGTLLMLALCDERTGRTASAWEEYREALARAERERRPDRAELARRHVASLEPRLVRVHVRLAEEDASLPGLEVRRDGEPMTSLGPTPMDPGAHVFEVFAVGERRWAVTVTVGGEPAEQEVLVPKLRLAPAPPAAPAAAPPVAPPLREPEPPRVAAHGATVDGLRLGAYGAAALALAGIAIGSFYGVRAIDQRRDAERLCPAYPCAPGAAGANDAAKAAAITSNIAFAAAGVSALGALTFVLLDGGAARGSTGGAPNGGSRSVAGVALGWEGTW